MPSLKSTVRAEALIIAANGERGKRTPLLAFPSFSIRPVFLPCPPRGASQLRSSDRGAYTCAERGMLAPWLKQVF